MTFLKNIWYAAAWADQVAPGALVPRTILNDGVLLFRDTSGRALALRDRCPHRFAPLHMGKLKGDVVECGYHGLQFNGRGTCVLNPHGEGQIPSNAKVRNYPLEERHDVLWIWMGEAERADASLIPDFSSVFNDGNAIVRHYLNVKANYELMIDNLLDLGHTAYLHPDSLGSEAIIHSTRETRVEGETVVDELWAPNGEPPPLANFLFPQYRGVRIDHWLASTWHAPSLIVGVAGYALAGRNCEGAESMPGCHLLTPETESTCHYFAALGRNFRQDDPQLDAVIDMAVSKAFSLEDMPMVASIQDELNVAAAEDQRPVVLASDTAGLFARRILARKIEEESRMVASPARNAAGNPTQLQPEHA